MRLEKRRVILFVAITFLLSWGLAAYPWFGGMTQDSLNQPALLLGGYMWMPALASLLDPGLLTCQGFFRSAGGRIFAERGKYHWWGWSPAGWLLSLAGVVYFAPFPGRFALNLGFPQLEGSTLLAVLLAGGMVLVVPVNVFTGDLGRAGLAILFPQLCKLTTPGMQPPISGINLGSLAHAAYLYGLGLWSGLSRLSLAGVAVPTLRCGSDERVDHWLTCRAVVSGQRHCSIVVSMCCTAFFCWKATLWASLLSAAGCTPVDPDWRVAAAGVRG